MKKVNLANLKLANLLMLSIRNEVLATGIFVNSKLILYANVNSSRRVGIYKYIITPHSYTETRLFDLSFNDCISFDEFDQSNEEEKCVFVYLFVFENLRTSETMFFDADSIEDLCDQLDIKPADYDEMVVFLSKMCPDVPIKGNAERVTEPENKNGE